MHEENKSASGLSGPCVGLQEQLSEATRGEDTSITENGKALIGRQKLCPQIIGGALQAICWMQVTAM